MTSAGNVTVLISGRGSNLKALIQHQSTYRIAHVVTDNPEAKGLELAKEAGIPFTIVPRSKFPSRDAFKAAVLQTVQATNPALVALAGFMVVLQPEFTERFYGRLINIHPSLLPNFPGLHTHERALEAKVTEHGCTVHFVDSGVDTGPLIAQAKVQVHPSDTAEELAARVLTHEHRVYPWIVQSLVRGDITLQDRTAHYAQRVREEARDLGYTIFS